MRGSRRELDFSIRGDEIEQTRIALEQNLQHTDLSLHLSSAHEVDHYDDSVEYPRHFSGPEEPGFSFRSMEHDERSFISEDAYRGAHAWSYRSGEDEEGIHAYAGGETLSTAAHHASALTLSAGLGGRGHRRDVSLSGAEYDPDRPLQDLVAHAGNKLFEDDGTRSRAHVSDSVPFDPLVVDSTAELDRILSSQHARAAALRSASSSSSSNSGSSEPDTPDPTSPTTSRPKLSDALSHLTFSPKRPRSPALVIAGSRSSSPALSYTRSHRSRASNPVIEERQEDEPTPRATRTQHPAIKVRPPTPSTANSKFTKLARGIARDIQQEQEQSRWDFDPDGEREPGVLAQSTVRAKKTKPSGIHAPAVKSSFGNGRANTSARRASGGRATVQLPDVTGITNAVESPAKGGLQYYAYEDDADEYGDGKARLIASLGVVQTKLAHLDAENNASRRRMRELEGELEVCKQEVRAERERVMRHEETLARHVEAARHDRDKGKARADTESAEDKRRYREAVEEKKALENLINTLRTHMARLTTELASHQSMLDELRGLREADARTLRDKVREVDRLRGEVERVAMEVEVLRGVVEEGLRERREKSQVHLREVDELRRQQRQAEAQRQQAEAQRRQAEELLEQHQEAERQRREAEVREEELLREEEQRREEEEQRQAEEEQRQAEEEQRRAEETEEEAQSTEMEVDEEEDTGPVAPAPRRANVTMRTNQATLGSSQIEPSTSHRFINDTELERISQEMEERRSERSASQLSASRSSLRSQSSRHSQRAASASLSGSERMQAAPESDFSVHLRAQAPSPAHLRAQAPSPSHLRAQAPSPAPSTRAAQRLRRHASQPQPQSEDARPGAPTPAHAVRPPDAEQAQTPFPQIRGAKLERLFFSAPAHNATTCRMCNRRRRRRGQSDDEDEGFAEGEEEGAPAAARGQGQGPDRMPRNLDFLRKDAPQDRLPPQTVLMRVVRELEDDFSHYKGIYTELADQYKLMDPASNVVKRNVLAEHLREVIDVLEQKGDQIASLYDLLSFEDKPAAQSVVPDRAPGPSTAGKRALKRHTTLA